MRGVRLREGIVHQQHLALVALGKDVRFIAPHVVEQAREDHEGGQEAFTARVARDLPPGDPALVLRFDLEKLDANVRYADDVIIKRLRRQPPADELMQRVFVFQQLDAALRKRSDLFFDACPIGIFVLIPIGDFETQHLDRASTHRDA